MAVFTWFDEEFGLEPKCISLILPDEKLWMTPEDLVHAKMSCGICVYLRFCNYSYAVYS